MPVAIPDEVLRQAGLTEREALVEIACRSFDAGKLTLWPAAQLAGLSRIAFIGELQRRSIPAFRVTIEDVEHDLAVLGRLGV